MTARCFSDMDTFSAYEPAVQLLLCGAGGTGGAAIAQATDLHFIRTLKGEQKGVTGQQEFQACLLNTEGHKRVQGQRPGRPF